LSFKAQKYKKVVKTYTGQRKNIHISLSSFSFHQPFLWFHRGKTCVLSIGYCRWIIYSVFLPRIWMVFSQ